MLNDLFTSLMTIIGVGIVMYIFMILGAYNTYIICEKRRESKKQIH